MKNNKKYETQVANIKLKIREVFPKTFEDIEKRKEKEKKPNFKINEDIVEYIEVLSNNSEEKAIRDLKEMYRISPECFKQLVSDFRKYNEKWDEKNKEFLYQELVYLEEKRYSLQRRLKDIEGLPQNKELKVKLVNLSIKVVYLRALIIFYRESGKRCEMLVKELLEKESQ